VGSGEGRTEPEEVRRALRFTAEADIDIARIHQWYDARSPRRSRRFLGALELALVFITEFPEAGPMVHKDLRRVSLRGFTYAVYYRITESTLEIRGCLHGRRNPRAWRSRA